MAAAPWPSGDAAGVSTPPAPGAAAAAAGSTTGQPLPPELGERILRATQAQLGGGNPGGNAAPAPASAKSAIATPIAAAVAPRALHTVFFDYASAELRGPELAFAKRVAAAAAAGARVTIVGMTDRTGDPAKNERLGQRRADAMLLLLAQAGVDPDLVTIQIDTTATRTVPPQTMARAMRADGDARFRRVDVLITYGAETNGPRDRSASTTLFGAPSPYEIVSMRGIAQR
jgi:outer membrane protein OmpA-like peptidoglycan-associated protein